jgi:hypothetical protein
MGRLDDIQKLKWNAVLLIKPLHSAIEIRLVKCLDLRKKGMNGHFLISRLFDEDGISEGKYSLLECQFVKGDAFAWIASFEDVYGVTIPLVYVLSHVLQADSSTHAQQMRRIHIQQYILILYLLILEKGLNCFARDSCMRDMHLSPKATPSGVSLDCQFLLGRCEKSLIGILPCTSREAIGALDKPCSHGLYLN